MSKAIWKSRSFKRYAINNDWIVEIMHDFVICKRPVKLSSLSNLLAYGLKAFDVFGLAVLSVAGEPSQ